MEPPTPADRPGMPPVGTSQEYVTSRNLLLIAEKQLMKQIEAVAEMRRALPRGPKVQKKYSLATQSKTNVDIADLFQDNQYLVMYFFMFGENSPKPCPMCNLWAKGFDAVEKQFATRASFVLASPQGIEKFQEWGKSQGWKNLRLVSYKDTSLGLDYGFQTPDYESKPETFSLNPGLVVFEKDSTGNVFYRYSHSAIMGKNINRGIDLLNPLWNMFDLLPNGRGEWMPTDGLKFPGAD